MGLSGYHITEITDHYNYYIIIIIIIKQTYYSGIDC